MVMDRAVAESFREVKERMKDKPPEADTQIVLLAELLATLIGD